jgi:hypothetical protein
MNPSHITSACYGQKTVVTFCAIPLRGRKSRQLFLAADASVSFRKRRKKIKGGVVKVVKKGIQRTILWLYAAKAGYYFGTARGLSAEKLRPPWRLKTVVAAP